jgi:putative FmdB family regulatory protein
MPLYEYKCRDCSAEFEVLRRTTEPPRCPSCGRGDLQQLLSSFAVNSPERSRAVLAKARKQYQASRGRHEQLRHEREEVREHLREDYGVDLPEKAPDKSSS